MLKSNSFLVATASMFLAFTIPATVPALGADVKQTPSVSEAEGCQDLRETMGPLLRSRKELTEAIEHVQGDNNRTTIQGIRDRIVESVKQTNSMMNKLQCVKTNNQLPASP